MARPVGGPGGAAAVEPAAVAAAAVAAAAADSAAVPAAGAAGLSHGCVGGLDGSVPVLLQRAL